MASDAPDYQTVIVIVPPGTSTDCPDWQHQVTGPGGTGVGGYASLTGPGETSTDGALYQTGAFYVGDGDDPASELEVVGGSIYLFSQTGAGITLSSPDGTLQLGDDDTETAIVLKLPTTAGASGTLWNDNGVVSVAP